MRRPRRFAKRQAMAWAKRSSKYFSASRIIRRAWVKKRFSR